MARLTLTMEYLLVLWWLLALGGLAILAYPLTSWLFGRFSTMGVGFSPLVGVTVLTIVVYWTGQVSFSWWNRWLALFVLVALSILVSVDLKQLAGGQIAIDANLRADRNAIAWSVGIFIAAFLFLVAIRAADPAIQPAGGEKFLDYGLLRVLFRAESLPPPDMWFAGEPLQYYYGGHLAATILGQLTATPPQYAYNLALASFYAMLVTAAFDLAGNVAAARGRSRLVAGGFTVLFVGLASNLLPVARLGVSMLPTGLQQSIATRVSTAANVETAEVLAGLDGFSYWTASRVIPGTINEFPLFAWLNGDLHAHMMGATFLLLAVAVSFAYWLTPADELWHRRLLVFGVLPLLGGFQIPTDTWSFPTIFGVAWLALAFGSARPLPVLPGGEQIESSLRSLLRGDRVTSDNVESFKKGDAESGETPLVAEVLQTGGALLVIGLAGVIGFLLGFTFLLGASAGQSIAILDAADRSGLGGLLFVHGTFVAAFLGYLGVKFGSDNRVPFVAAIGLLAVAGTIAHFPGLVIVAPLLVGGWIVLRMNRDVGFETALIIGGAGLITIVELVYVAEEAGPGRFNTVFKTYFQVWLLWALAMGPVLAGLLESIEADRISNYWPSASSRETVIRVFVALLVITALPYAALALGAHFDRHDIATLDATSGLAAQQPQTAAAIAYLDETVIEGGENDDVAPVLLEAPGAYRSPTGLADSPSQPGMYSWESNPASSFTGIPTVAGWQHQVGYRGPDVYWSRVNDVDRAYAGSKKEQVAVLDTYAVTHIWVGPGERARYGSVSFAHIDGVSLVFESETVRIYRVDHDELST